MDLHANRMIFADDKYCRAAMPLAIPGGIAHNHRMFNLDVIPARRLESNPWGPHRPWTSQTNKPPAGGIR